MERLLEKFEKYIHSLGEKFENMLDSLMQVHKKSLGHLGYIKDEAPEAEGKSKPELDAFNYIFEEMETRKK